MYITGTMIGARFVLNVPMLGNPSGVIGYCFAEYEDFDDPNELGVQVIFPNGEYDGFSADEQKRFLTFLDYNMLYANYKFTSVIQVGIDYAKGYWMW